MVAVNESTLKGYPHASISSRGAFDWALNKIVRDNATGFKLLVLHVQVPDEDGTDFDFRIKQCLLYMVCKISESPVKFILNLCYDV